MEMANILLDPDMNKDKICRILPVNIEHNVAFVIDLSELENPKDVSCDDMGFWKYNGVFKTWIEVDECGIVSHVGKKKPNCVESAYFKVSRSQD